jgi:RNA polymerase sigma factor (sigma-70 family)
MGVRQSGGGKQGDRSPVIASVDLAAVIAGDRSARAAFVDAHARLVHAVVVRTLRHHATEVVDATVEDLFAECFVAMFDRDARRLRQWTARCSLASWVRLVATSTVIDHLRRTRPPSEEGIERLPDGQAPLLELLVRAEDHLRVRAALARLAEADRELLVAMFVDEESVASLTSRLGIATGALYTRKNRAIERLKAAFEELGES